MTPRYFLGPGSASITISGQNFVNSVGSTTGTIGTAFSWSGIRIKSHKDTVRQLSRSEFGAGSGPEISENLTCI